MSLKLLNTNVGICFVAPLPEIFLYINKLQNDTGSTRCLLSCFLRVEHHTLSFADKVRYSL